jgi:hypothetical protein
LNAKGLVSMYVEFALSCKDVTLIGDGYRASGIGENSTEFLVSEEGDIAVFDLLVFFRFEPGDTSETRYRFSLTITAPNGVTRVIPGFEMRPPDRPNYRPMDPQWDTQHIPLNIAVSDGVYHFTFEDETGVRFVLAENVFLLPTL